ncbi:MAG: uracil-DNA glycosylase family protein [Patescibacteria group bacterium]
MNQDLNKEILLQNIAQDVKNCQKCQLCLKRTNTVPGNGDLNSELVFVGEGPGKNEDLQGVPFVGAAGKYLDKLLASIGLTRPQIFITNIVKCRPPDNRDPLPEEVATCSPFLAQQLQIIKPKLIITLGRHAMNFFLPNLKISSAHGQPKRYQGQVYLPLYHPAAGLYNPATRTDIDSDFLKIPAILQKIKNDELKKQQ